jgi:hypothetical protein
MANRPAAPLEMTAEQRSELGSANRFVRFAGQAVELLSDVDNVRKVSQKARQVPPIGFVGVLDGI